MSEAAPRFPAAGPKVWPVADLHLALDPGAWEEAAPHRPAIDAHFAARAARNPALFNGRILLLRDAVLDGEGARAVLRGTCVETDYAAFLWWRDAGFPEMGVRNIFSLPALEDAGGAFLLGEMAPHTVNAGHLYFPCGTPDLSDIAVGGAVDLAGSALRELAEETGLAASDVTPVAGWSLVFDGAYVAAFRRLTLSAGAAAAAARVRAFLAADPNAELCAIHVVRAEADLRASVMPHVARYIRWRWAQAPA